MQTFYQVDCKITYGNTANNLYVSHNNYTQIKVGNSYQEFKNSIVSTKKYELVSSKKK